MIELLLLPLLLLPLLGGPPASAADPRESAPEEVEVLWPDGTVRCRYGVDSRGRLEGTYVEYFENGRLYIKARYRADRLHGSYETFFPDGKREITTTYRDGFLQGKYEEREESGELYVTGKYEKGEREGLFEFFRDGKPLSRQLFAAGELVELDGIIPHPRTQEEIRATLDEIYDPANAWPPEPSSHQTKSTPGDAEADLTAEERADQDRDREAALRHLMAYRYLSGLEWRDMELDAVYNYYASMAARLLRVIGRLDHTPENPGLPEKEYRDGYKGTSSSNLAAGNDLRGSIDAYMNDSDEKNIGRVGHRNWCLNPRMLCTGFGKRGGFSAMWSFDESRASLPKWSLVPYPAPGWSPCEYFGPRHAWSVRLNPSAWRQPKKEEVEVTIHALDDEYLPLGEPLELDHLDVVGHLLIFRPVGLQVVPGSRYLCAIAGLGGGKKGAPLVYLVEFFPRRAEGE